MTPSEVLPTESVAGIDDDGADVPRPESAVAAADELIRRGKQRGYVTHEELTAAVAPERVADAMAALSEMGVNVVDGQDADDENDDAPADGGEAAGGDDAPTADPVRMYLRDTGRADLLTREAEIALAKRIEAGREMMLRGVCGSPPMLDAIAAWREALASGDL